MKKMYVIALVCLWLGKGRSQNFDWANRAGSWAYDYGYGIATDVNGNVYCAGKYELNADFSGTTVTCEGNHDIFLAQYSPGGALNWVRTGGGAMGDYAHALACDRMNYVYIAGELEGWGHTVSFPGSPITLNVAGDNDIFVAKYDLAGNLLWAKNEGSWHNEKALGVTYDNAGNVFICGLYNDTAIFNGNVILYGNGDNDIFVAKYDANGNFQWVQHAGSSGRDEAKGIACDVSGNVYICGMYSNGANFGGQILGSANGYYDAFIAKYNGNGDLQWVQTAGGDYDEVAWSMALDNAGKIFVTGEFNASAYFGNTQLITTGNADVFVACYDAAGNTLWAKGAGGPLIDRARGIGCDGNNVFITGQFGASAGFGPNTIIAADSSDVFFVGLDNNGNFISAISAGGAPDSVETLGYESGIAICAEASGNVYATGGSLDGATFGNNVLETYERTDIYVTKISQLTSSGPHAISQRKLALYPNPSSGRFRLSGAEFLPGRTEALIYNSLGEVILRKVNEPFTQITLNLADQESGLYFIEIKNAERNILLQKVILQK